MTPSRSWHRRSNRAFLGLWTTIRATRRLLKFWSGSRRSQSYCAVRLIPLLLLALAFFPRMSAAQEGAISFLEDRVRSDPDDFVAQNQLAARYLDLLHSGGDDAYLAKAR